MPLLLLTKECPEQPPFRDDTGQIHPYCSGRGNQLRLIIETASNRLMSRQFISIYWIGFPHEWTQHYWTLKFRQYSFHHIDQVLRSHLR